jgi:hypothetical protein
MSQQSEERVSDLAESPPATARVVPFERPQSELQRAVQQRAQEAIELERARAASRRPPVWRRGLVLALATIPVFITFGAAVGFIGALRQFNSAVLNSQPAAPADNAGQTTSQPSTSLQGDIVMLQPLAPSNAPSKSRDVAPVSPPAQ